MMRIVFISKSALPNPMAHGRAMTKMCEAFARRGADVELWYPCQTDRQLASRNVFEFYDVPAVFRVRALGRLPSLPGVIRRRVDSTMRDPFKWGRFAALLARVRRADLYVTRSIELAYWLTRAGLPTICELHQPSTAFGDELLKEVGGQPALRGVVALTHPLRDYATSFGVPEQKVVVHPSGVDLEPFQGPLVQSECRRRLGLPADTPIVGYIGRFRMWDAREGRRVEKGLRMLITAFQKVGPVRGVSPFLLCVGGPADSIREYEQLARELGLESTQYRFVDRVPPSDVAGWMRACDVVTLPWSAEEDFGTESLSPLKLFEYMAAKLPIVATDVPAFREPLRHGENAWLVERGDVPGFAAALRLLLSDEQLRATLANQAYRDVQQYTWSERAAALCRLAGCSSEPSC